MSNPDSFIDEVTEEVRRDRLYGLFRRYGWIGGVLILGIVGGTAANEFLKTRAESRAQAFGDAVIDAFDMGSPEERRAALAAVPADGDQKVILALIEASDPAQDKAESLAALDRILADAGLAPVYRDLAVLRRVLVAGTDQPLADRRAALEPIAVAGRPYRGLAAEQLAYLLLEEGKPDQAIAALQALTQASDTTAALKSRAAQVITALGGTPAPQAAPASEAPAEAAPSGG
ncbi:hypothetical protein [Xinfangfangia pollutisoli]|uniref:hypothetical protein n=1 Tax=Xinfangfangia pollutisoli TaxID=2865960 RepID=UPI001CD818E5|nr:hypothetical protein [Xinfangfangia pollutisoli]